jgi:hypothetical protein
MTGQVSEILKWRKRKLSLCDAPLYEYLQALSPDLRPKFARSSTACGRGYIGTWEIRDGMLALVALDGHIHRDEGVVRANLRAAFPWVKGALAATWFTGRLRCGDGPVVRARHAGFARIYEKDRYLDFEHGKLVGEYVVTSRPPPTAFTVAPDGACTSLPPARQNKAKLPKPEDGNYAWSIPAWMHEWEGEAYPELPPPPKRGMKPA